ncbi:hypothetical protein FOZ61_008326 [Perkinsus olseni]|uniref:Uncharacterized protein n=1 Tax=Perkinsus olseni TaxID=32597 RepID=A0A7J6LBT6_PEROL|nr:hypothetical protein FOZ61_008326 [Perkinsus olseni]KAF4656727.1 hypothetical protein FOL46_007713 [Perkinsus olseni]
MFGSFSMNYSCTSASTTPMMNFVSTWLLFAQALVISTAQDIGRFAYEESFFNMYYDVNEDKEVKLTVEVPRPRHGRGDIPPSVDQAFGPYPLRKEEGFTYTIDFKKSGISRDDWDQSIETFLRDNGVLEHDDPFNPGDLATLTYTSGDEFFVNLGDEELLFLRVGRDLVPGEYVYKEPVSPRMRISYKIFDNGTGGVLVKCRRRSTSRFAHMLHRRDRGLQYLHHAVESAGRGTLDQFRDQVRYVCPGKRVLFDDFSRVVAATDRTIYVEVEGGRLALTKV